MQVPSYLLLTILLAVAFIFGTIVGGERAARDCKPVKLQLPFPREMPG